ncbi:MAG: hypothetical protein IKX75_05965, partial [Desulfovibrio sp.]|nr:hypothetical protein [Desulfovibrio sp.]
LEGLTNLTDIQVKLKEVGLRIDPDNNLHIDFGSHNWKRTTMHVSHDSEGIDDYDVDVCTDEQDGITLAFQHSAISKDDTTQDAHELIVKFAR